MLDGLREGETIVAGTYQAIRDLKDGARVREADTTKTKKDAEIMSERHPRSATSPANTTWAERDPRACAA